MSDGGEARRPTVSAAVICLDEARNIGACLDSLAWCDEIVVVDAGSRDGTVEIARKLATRVLHHDWPGYVAQKNWALDQTTGDWILCIDADERCTPQLRAAIEAKLRTLANESPHTDQSNQARFPRSEPKASGAITMGASDNESPHPDRSDEARFPRSEPKASGAITMGASDNESPHPDRSDEARFPRSEPKASGAITMGASDNESPHPDRSDEARFPRSEPKASGATTKAASDNEAPRSDQRDQARFPRSEPQASGAIIGLELRRHVFYLGRWIDHGGWYPDWKLRLVRRGRARWGGIDPHDKLIADGPVGRLDADLVHFTYADFAAHLRTVQRFSDVVSDEWVRAGRRFSLWRAVLHPPVKFFECYVWKRGLLDGWPGFVIAAASSFYVFTKYVKLWEKTSMPASRPS